jgi:MFS family permease
MSGKILELSPSERLRSRKVFATFTVFNTVSFLLLTGNIITLYLLRLGASGTVIGAVSSFTYISYFLMFFGRNIVDKVGVARLFCSCWTLRYIMAAPMVFSPVCIMAGRPGMGFGLVVAGSLGFQMLRGIGLVSNSPIIGDISEGRDRGDYLSVVQILTQAASIFAGLAIAFFLSSGETSLFRYTWFILAGIVSGLIGSLLLFRMPSHTGSVQSQAAENFLASLKRAFAEKSFRRFMLMFFLIMFSAGMGRPFIIVYAAQVYGMSDDLTMYLSVVGYLGALFMGIIARVLLDRLGAKPILVFFTGAFLLGLVFFIIGPPLMYAWEAFLFLTVGFFVFNLGSIGQENAAQTYFYAAVKPEDQMNWGMIYFFIFGFGGTFGSLAGGFLLDSLAQNGFSVAASHRIFFGVLFVLTALIIGGLCRIKGFGLYSVRHALNMIFSARDLRAIVLSNRLDRSRSFEDEKRVIREMRTTPSEVSVEGLLARLKSPSFMIRMETLRVLEAYPADSRIVRALMNEVENHEYTTARTAARILGVKEAHSALGVLRTALKSEDYLLCAESMVSLARLRDKQSIRRIELILKVTVNPLLVIFGAEALRVYGDMSSLPVLLELLERGNLSGDIRKQVMLSIAGVLGMDEWFYPFFSSYIDDPVLGVLNLFDFQGRRRAGGEDMAALRKRLAGQWPDEAASRSLLAQMIDLAAFPKTKAEFLRSTLQGVLANERLARQEILFLLAAVCIWHESPESG